MGAWSLPTTSSEGRPPLCGSRTTEGAEFRGVRSGDCWAWNPAPRPGTDRLRRDRGAADCGRAPLRCARSLPTTTWLKLCDRSGLAPRRADGSLVGLACVTAGIHGPRRCALAALEPRDDGFEATTTGVVATGFTGGRVEACVP